MVYNGINQFVTISALFSLIKLNIFECIIEFDIYYIMLYNIMRFTRV